MTKLQCFIVLLMTCSLMSAQNPNGNIIRCSSVEYNQSLYEKYPHLDNQDLFEKWMAKAIKERANDPLRSVATYNIPVIFHVIHNGQAVGATPNVDGALIQAQLDQLNIDFSNMAGSTHPAAADTDIQFCFAQVDEGGNVLAEPGINRRHRNEFGFTAPSWSSNYVDGTIKPATQWNPDDYCNIWVLDISGGLLGWAQFPDATGLPGMPTGTGGPADEDGVVVLYSSVGSIANPFGGGSAAYDNGRTLTHEIGHWLGLRHIWGDGGCTVDDFCNDTPTAGGSNFGCPNNDSCDDGAGDQGDMVENFMDYTDDDCMDIFTAEQAARMQVVVDPANNIARRGALQVSTVCDLSPTIGFKEASTSIIEGTDCSTITVNIEVEIAQSGSSNPGAVITVDGSSSATTPADYTVLTPAVTFPSGTTTTQFVSVLIQRDGINEPGESIVLKLTTATGDGVIGGNDTHTIGIANDDPLPGSVSGYSFEDQDFDASMGAWTNVDGGDAGDSWALATTGGGGNSLNGTQFIFVDSDAAGNGSVSYEELFSPVINCAGATNLFLSFDHYFRAYTAGYDETASVDVYDGAAWVNVFTRSGNTQGSLGTWTNPNIQNIDVSAYANANFQVRFTYDAEWDWYWAVDNVTLIGDFNLPIETVVNSASGFASVNFGPNETIHFVDENTGNLMLSLENLTGHNYGCTDVEIDNAGTFAYNSPAPESTDITDKNFIVTPEFNNPSGSYQITLYYTAAEIAGWEADNTQGDTKADLFMVKNAAGAVTSATTLELAGTSPVAYGTDWSFTSTYSTGFSGFGLGNMQVVPVEFIDFSARAKTHLIQLDWATAVEINNAGFEIWRGLENRSFEQIGFVEGQGMSQERVDYIYEDKDVIKGERYYYKLRQVDEDGHFEWTDVRSANLDNDVSSVGFTPNPVFDEIIITKGDAAIETIEIYDLTGRKFMQINWNTQANLQKLDVSNLPQGAYFMIFKNGSKHVDQQRFIKV